MQPDVHRCGTASSCGGSAGGYHSQSNLSGHCAICSLLWLRGATQQQKTPACPLMYVGAGRGYAVNSAL